MRLNRLKAHVCEPWSLPGPATFGEIYECICGRRHACIGPGLQDGGFSPERWRRVYWWGVWSR